MITLGELLHGTDEDFLTNLYLAVLGRWPDETGFEHHLRSLAGRPQQRLATLREFQDSAEGREKGRALATDEAPVTAERALAAQLRLRTEVLRAEIAQWRERPAAGGPSPALAGEVAALGAALTGLGQELRERMAALEATLAGRVPMAPNLSPAVSIDYVNDLIEAAQAGLAQRLRGIEKRLLDEPDA